jgi:hypothetical protein
MSYAFYGKKRAVMQHKSFGRPALLASKFADSAADAIHSSIQ